MTAGRLMIGDISIWATLGEAAALRLTYDRSPYISNQPMPTEKPTSSLHDLFGEAAPRPASGAEVVQVVGRKVTLYRKNPEKTIIELK